MRKPTRPEHLYVDFDGFCASCEEQANPPSPVRLSYRGHSVSICAQQLCDRFQPEGQEVRRPVAVEESGAPAGLYFYAGWPASVRQMSEATGHTTGSIYWRLKRTGRKQSISRQADLVRLVLSIVQLG